MVNFYSSERVDVIMFYGVADGNARLARELWIKRFPNRAIPCASVCANIYISGTAYPRSWYLKPQIPDHGHDKTVRILQAEEQILERFEEEPDISTH